MKTAKVCKEFIKLCSLLEIKKLRKFVKSHLTDLILLERTNWLKKIENAESLNFLSVLKFNVQVI